MSQPIAPPLPELEIVCEQMVADRYSAAPSVLLRLRVRELTGANVQALALRCQVRIEPLRRSYDEAEAARVVDLFGDRARWGTTMHALQLGYVDRVLPGFSGESTVDLPLQLSYDVEVAAHKYLAALEDGEIPLLLLFSGQVFSSPVLTTLGRGPSPSLTVQPIGWHTEATARLPVAVWREAMDVHFPGQAWLRLSREVYDRLAERRGELALPGWDALLTHLLEER